MPLFIHVSVKVLPQSVLRNKLCFCKYPLLYHEQRFSLSTIISETPSALIKIYKPFIWRKVIFFFFFNVVHLDLPLLFSPLFLFLMIHLLCIDEIADLSDNSLNNDCCQRKYTFYLQTSEILKQRESIYIYINIK